MWLTGRTRGLTLSADLLLLEIASRAAALILSRPRAARVVPRLVETVMVGTANTTVAETEARPVRATRQVRSFILCEVRVN